MFPVESSAYCSSLAVEEGCEYGAHGGGGDSGKGEGGMCGGDVGGGDVGGGGGMGGGEVGGSEDGESERRKVVRCIKKNTMSCGLVQTCGLVHCTLYSGKHVA